MADAVLDGLELELLLRCLVDHSVDLEARLAASGIPTRLSPRVRPIAILSIVLALVAKVVLGSGFCNNSKSSCIISCSEQIRRGDLSKRIESMPCHHLYRKLDTSVLCEERCKDHVQGVVGREYEGCQISGLVGATAASGYKVMNLMGPFNALRRCQLQLAGDRVVLCHEVYFTREAALADL